MDSAAESLRGIYQSIVDDKGRLKLPADFERFLGEGAMVFLTSFDERAVRIYPVSEWKRVQESLHSAEGKALLSAANDVGGEAEIDRQGRVFLPAELRRKVQMGATLVRLSWRRDHIEVVTQEQAFAAPKPSVDKLF
jgi:MraZ protein